ncbi:hypothetical protein AXG93_3960s1090 [Marchantia polymorpha subsp. ruderalis]|uniref:Uncharacterized protein n=1 Tax=Marchantia polymorpha subsp. ruderalis TaxID=1480154 RepID=A0A176VH80_MARPO|nr:hypothetical protein AXG93_3960s1090 [Marchantia polymorpha subsp. ruderalis]
MIRDLAQCLAGAAEAREAREARGTNSDLERTMERWSRSPVSDTADQLASDRNVSGEVDEEVCEAAVKVGAQLRDQLVVGYGEGLVPSRRTRPRADQHQRVGWMLDAPRDAQGPDRRLCRPATLSSSERSLQRAPAVRLNQEHGHCSLHLRGMTYVGAVGTNELGTPEILSAAMLRTVQVDQKPESRGGREGSAGNLRSFRELLTIRKTPDDAVDLGEQSRPANRSRVLVELHIHIFVSTDVVTVNENPLLHR